MTRHFLTLAEDRDLVPFPVVSRVVSFILTFARVSSLTPSPPVLVLPSYLPQHTPSVWVGSAARSYPSRMTLGGIRRTAMGKLVDDAHRSDVENIFRRLSKKLTPIKNRNINRRLPLRRAESSAPVRLCSAEL